MTHSTLRIRQARHDLFVLAEAKALAGGRHAAGDWPPWHSHTYELMPATTLSTVAIESRASTSLSGYSVPIPDGSTSHRWTMPLRLLTIRLRDIFVVPAAVPNEPAHSAPTPTIANALWPGAPSVALADPHQYSNCRERVYREEHPELCPIERAESRRPRSRAAGTAAARVAACRVAS